MKKIVRFFETSKNVERLGVDVFQTTTLSIRAQVEELLQLRSQRQDVLDGGDWNVRGRGFGGSHYIDFADDETNQTNQTSSTNTNALFDLKEKEYLRPWLRMQAKHQWTSANMRDTGGVAGLNMPDTKRTLD
jgi:hypothetical protein